MGKTMNLNVPDAMRRTVKDTVFSDLFHDNEYLLQLYRTLHPEDTTATVKDLENITIKNVLIDDLYNDLGFLVRDRLMVLVEAQSTWTENILIRALMYLGHTWRNYLKRKQANLYGSRRVALPRPEIYVIYVGDQKNCPEEISLSQEFFEGRSCSVEVRAKVLRGGGRDIISQYVTFCKVLTEQVKLHGPTEEAIRETIRICRDRDVLREYLTRREVEVMNIMTFLFNQKTAAEYYVNDVLNQGIAEGIALGEKRGIALGEKRGEKRGRAAGAMGAYFSLVAKGLLSLHDAAAQANMTEQEFTQAMQRAQN